MTCNWNGSFCGTWPTQQLFIEHSSGGQNVQGDVDTLVGSGEALPPESCQDVFDADPLATDGDNTISPNGNTFVVYCNDMAGTPSEFLTLVNTGATLTTAGIRPVERQTVGSHALTVQ